MRRTVVEELEPVDWDARLAARAAEWEARRDRKRAVAEELKTRRRFGLLRRHAAKLASVHEGCTVEPDGSVRCVWWIRGGWSVVRGSRR